MVISTSYRVAFHSTCAFSASAKARIGRRVRLFLTVGATSVVFCTPFRV